MPGEIAEVEGALIGRNSIGSHLLERLDQLGHAIEIGHQLRGTITAGFEKIIQARPFDIATRDLRPEQSTLPLQG